MSVGTSCGCSISDDSHRHEHEYMAVAADNGMFGSRNAGSTSACSSRVTRHARTTPQAHLTLRKPQLQIRESFSCDRSSFLCRTAGQFRPKENRSWTALLNGTVILTIDVPAVTRALAELRASTDPMHRHRHPGHHPRTRNIIAQNLAERGDDFHFRKMPYRLVRPPPQTK